MMLHVLVLSLAAATATAMVCPPNFCARMRCAAVTAENCVGGKVVKNGSYCGCCDICVMILAEGDKCLENWLGMMVRLPSSICGEGLTCDHNTYTCQKTQDIIKELSCTERVKQIEKHGPPRYGQFIPKCDPDGSYAPSQCQGSVCYCVDPKGVEIGYEVNIGKSENMDCQCARDRYAYMQTGLIGKMFFCTPKGSYQPIQCTGSVCYCADNMGNMKPGSPTVNIGDIDDLRC